MSGGRPRSLAFMMTMRPIDGPIERDREGAAARMTALSAKPHRPRRQSSRANVEKKEGHSLRRVISASLFRRNCY